MKDRSVECGPTTYVQCEFRHPATKTQDPREVHDHDRNITGQDTNPFSEEFRRTDGTATCGLYSPEDNSSNRLQTVLARRSRSSGQSTHICVAHE